MELSYFKIVGLLIIFERLALAATGQAVNVSISMNYTPASLGQPRSVLPLRSG